MTNKINGIDVSESVLTATNNDVYYSQKAVDELQNNIQRLQEENEKLKRKKDEYYLKTLDYEAKMSYLIQEIRKEANRLLFVENPIYGYNNSNYFEILAKYVLAKTDEVLMTEINKMFENAGIKGEWRDYRTKNGKIYEGKNPKNRNIRLCKPDFTTEKQLKIVEWFISNRLWLNLKSLDRTLDFSLDFDEKLAKLVNRLWDSLYDKEKEEIRNILK